MAMVLVTGWQVWLMKLARPLEPPPMSIGARRRCRRCFRSAITATKGAMPLSCGESADVESQKLTSTVLCELLTSDFWHYRYHMRVIPFVKTAV